MVPSVSMSYWSIALHLGMYSAYAEMAEDTGYEFGETVQILRNGQELRL